MAHKMLYSFQYDTDLVAITDMYNYTGFCRVRASWALEVNVPLEVKLGMRILVSPDMDSLQFLT